LVVLGTTYLATFTYHPDGELGLDFLLHFLLFLVELLQVGLIGKQAFPQVQHKHCLYRTVTSHVLTIFLGNSIPCKVLEIVFGLFVSLFLELKQEHFQGVVLKDL